MLVNARRMLAMGKCLQGNVGLLLGTEAPIMTPKSLGFSFLFMQGEASVHAGDVCVCVCKSVRVCVCVCVCARARMRVQCSACAHAWSLEVHASTYTEGGVLSVQGTANAVSGL